jgi:hypothetical protein
VDRLQALICLLFLRSDNSGLAARYECDICVEITVGRLQALIYALNLSSQNGGPAAGFDIVTTYVLSLCSDNGGPAAGFDLNYASNWPLRGVGLIFCTFSLLVCSGHFF